MVNEPLRAALARAGVEPEDLAAELEVDSKTVQRWVGGRVPHGRHRARIAVVLDRDEHELWPDVAPAAAPGDDHQDLLGIYAQATDVRAPDWRSLLAEARTQIDLLDHTLADLITTPGAVDQLADKARSGVRARIMVAHPQSIWVTSLAHQLGHAETDADGQTAVDRELTHALGLLGPLAGRDGIEVRTFWAERTASVLRFDDQMLVTVHLYAAPGRLAPLLHLRRRADGGLFDRFAEHIERVIDHASELVPADLLQPR